MIRVPKVRNKHGASNADVVIEQIKLCKANLRNIEEIAIYRKNREVRNEINRRLRECHNFLGMASGSRKFALLYREVGLTDEVPQVSEHAIPVSALTSLYEHGHPIEELAFYPVALISKKSDKSLRDNGFVKTGHDETFVFKRYAESGIRIETYKGVEIDVAKWTVDDHWDLIENTPEIKEIKNEVFSQIGTMEKPSKFGLGYESRKKIIEEYGVSSPVVDDVAFVLNMYFRESPPQSNGEFLDKMSHASNMGGFDPDECDRLKESIMTNKGLILAIHNLMDFSEPDA